MKPLTFTPQAYQIDGQSTYLMSGEFHYFRVPKADWRERMRLFKEAGGNCLATYIPWLIHEPQEGVFRFAYLLVGDADVAARFIADQDAGSRGLFVDFFGRKASTYKSIGLLAMQYNVPVVIGYARRTGRAFHFQIGVQDIIYPPDWEHEDKPLLYITQRYTKAIEDIVRRDPAQYLWLHRRWKTRPKGEPAEQYD